METQVNSTATGATGLASSRTQIIDEQHLGRASKRQAQCDQQPQQLPSQYDELIGAIDQGTSSTRFLAFEKGTGRLVASSQLEIKRITPREGWVEIDPNAIMSSVYATMANVHDQLLAKQHQLKPLAASSRNKTGESASCHRLLKCIGICNQRESAVVWDAHTGRPLYNVLVWMDNRTKDIVDDMIDSIPGRDFNHLKDKTGLPMSTYFSAFKLRWLIDHVPEVQAALRERRLLVGTVDSWILWNLTGNHLTDVTNASRTFLMDIETLQWDKTLCKQFKVPLEILPKILSSADDFGSLQFGPFVGTPVTGVIGDQSAALFGHNCLQLGQTKATFGTGCFIMQNIGPGPLNGALAGVQREAKRGLITTVGYKLRDRPVCYALEGSIKIAGAALTWLRDNMQLISNYEECDQLVNATTNSAGVFFVPALGGLYSPYWDPNAAGLFIGLSQFTRREHLVRATFDSIAFQTNDILSLMRGVTNGLMIDGGLCKSDNLCQILADITGCDINRPSMCETSALGAAMVAGCGAGIWDYESMLAHSNTPHEYACSSHQTHHYPHELLHYDESKFAHNHTKAFKARQPQANEQQESPTKHRRSLRHRNGSSSGGGGPGGRLMRNLDAGGGINDDAGGGGTAGNVKLRPVATATTSVAGVYSSDDELDHDCNEEADELSSGPLVSSDTDLEAGANLASSSSGCCELQDSINQKAKTTTTIGDTSELPAVIENHAIESSCESSYNAGQAEELASEHHRAKTRALTSLINNLNLNQGAAASSSGYSSGDNFESTASNSYQLTDSLRLLSSAASGLRTDSPLSQAAATCETISSSGGRNSAATCMEDLKQCDDQLAGQLLAANNPVTFLFNQSNLTGQQQQQLASVLNDSDRTITGTLVAPALVNNRKFAAKAEDVADEVHEFGGRDSYGEGGYDSSTVSFDSYDGYDDDEDDDNLIAREDQNCDGLVNQDEVRANPHGVISNNHNTAIIGAVGEQTDANHKRQHRASLVEKQMDVFQPYISLEHRTELVDTWGLAVTRSMQWTKVLHEEIRRIDYQRLSSLPISMYVFFSIGLVALSSCLSPMSLLSHK